jgi:hypothetical protein
MLASLFVLLAILCVALSFDLPAFVKEVGISKDERSLPKIGLKLLQTARTWAEQYLKDHPEAKASEYPYFNFMPMFRAGLVPDKDAYGPTKWSASCFAENSAVASTQSDGSIKITVTSGVPKTDTCYDHYLLMTNTGIDRLKIVSTGETSFVYKVPADLTDAEKWDLNQKGIRVMELLTDEPTTVANLLETVLLFVPEFTQGVDKKSAERNVDFINKYTPFNMQPRDPSSNRPPPAEQVKSGDFFGIIRLDGLDPMLAWGMGSNTGHTTVALWIDGELYVCESTAVSSYWPTNGIQKTPNATWLKQAELAGFNVVHAPLNAATRALFNESAAIDFFRTVEGVNYGYYNMFWGWVDTLYDNYPCVPSDYSSVCLTWEAIEPLFATIDRHIPQISSMMWNPAFNKRIGTTDLNTAQIYQTAMEVNQIPSRVIPTIVEQDEWRYNTTRYEQPYTAPSLVCCVFVCNVWKAAGVFQGMDVNCAEQTNIDDYSLQIFEDQYEQILGEWTLNLAHYNSKVPFPHMAETCPTHGPDYIQTPSC